jgi:hypothetical protein
MTADGCSITIVAGWFAALSRELKEKDSQIQELRQAITSLENKVNELSIQTKKQL